MGNIRVASTTMLATGSFCGSYFVFILSIIFSILIKNYQCNVSNKVPNMLIDSTGNFKMFVM